MAVTQLNASSAGISRLRTKGGAQPDTLYDLVNGYVDASGAISMRPGTVVAADLPAGTIGMCAFNGGLTVFASSVIGGFPVTGVGVTVNLEVLTHPDGDGTLVAIHYAGPFLGSLFVTAEWSDGRIVDYWLIKPDPWSADKTYGLGDLVSPTTPNGLVYRVNRLGEPGAAWAPDVERALNDVVEPTVQNGFEYVAIEVHGDPPRSGKVEPTWPTEAGAIVIEEADQRGSSAPTPPPPTTPPQRPPGGIEDRYRGNLGKFLYER